MLKKVHILSYVFYLFLLNPRLVSAQTALLDDFNRVNNPVVGNGWTEVENGPTGASISSNVLMMGHSIAGREFVWRDVTALYNTVLNTNNAVQTWAFNFRQTRIDPSGFDPNNYGEAFVLGCTSSNFLTGNGYAVVFGNSGTPDNIRLVRFTGGLNSNLCTTNIIASITGYTTDFMTIKVIYNPVGNNWSLYIGSNLAAFTNPTATVYTQIGATTSDNTYTGNDLMYLGCFWNHATSGTDFSFFDNINIPAACILNTTPTVQTSALSISAIGANSVSLSWTNGNGGQRIVIGRKGAAVVSVPVNGTTYLDNSVFGSGTLLAANEYVVYQGSGNSVVVTGLFANTFYEFRVFEFNGVGCTSNYMTTTPATSSATTIGCVLASSPTVQSSGLIVSSTLSNSLLLNWTRGNGAYCIVVCRPLSSVTTPPSDGVNYNANSIFGLGSLTAPGEYVVYSGTGSTVLVKGLNAATTYYFAVFELNGTGCNTNYLTTPFSNSSASTSPSGTFTNYFGNLHSHSDYSDGDVDNTCNGANSAYCCYTTGNTALNFDFMGISDHNHNEGSVMTPAKYASGLAEATSYIAANPNFVALYGMEWGTISTGGHVAVYGIDQLVGWNVGNYDVYCAKGDYNSLFNLVASTPDAFATLCHPNATDFGNIAGIPYNMIYDNAIVGTAVKNGPFLSSNTTYSDPALTNYISYYNTLLGKGYHLGPTIDLDNHISASMGKSSQGRTVVLASSLTKAGIMDAIYNMRFYATEDYNMNISFNVNSVYPMGSIVTQTNNPTISVSVSDPDGEATTSIKIFYGIPFSNLAPTVLTSVLNQSSLSFTHSIAASTFYYYAEITQADGNKAWTAPIWFSKITTPLPVSLLSFTGTNVSNGNMLNWVTASETNNDYFTLERSSDGQSFNEITKVKGAGTTSSEHSYKFNDILPPAGINYYRLVQTDFDGTKTESEIIALKTKSGLRDILIYPNPNNGTFMISSSSDLPDNFQIKIFDILNREVSFTETQSGKIKLINIFNKAEGVYTVQIVSGDDVMIQRFVLNPVQ